MDLPICAPCLPVCVTAEESKGPRFTSRERQSDNSALMPVQLRGDCDNKRQKAFRGPSRSFRAEVKLFEGYYARQAAQPGCCGSISRFSPHDENSARRYVIPNMASSGRTTMTTMF
jgi:hypothetical protein